MKLVELATVFAVNETHTVEVGDIAVSKTLKRIEVVTESNKAQFKQSYIAVRSERANEILNFLQSETGLSRLKEQLKGTAMPIISVKSLAELKID